jgi:hypothetical protein
MKLDRSMLDRFIRETDRLGGLRTAEWLAFWRDLIYQSSVPLEAQNRPLSKKCAAQREALYREIIGHDYADRRDEHTDIPTYRSMGY